MKKIIENREYLIAYNSITLVMQIKKIMESYGETVYVTPTPKSIPVNDCSYSVRIKGHQLKRVIEISEEHEFQVKGIYTPIDENEYEKVVI